MGPSFDSHEPKEISKPILGLLIVVLFSVVVVVLVGVLFFGAAYYRSKQMQQMAVVEDARARAAEQEAKARYVAQQQQAILVESVAQPPQSQAGGGPAVSVSIGMSNELSWTGGNQGELSDFIAAIDRKASYRVLLLCSASECQQLSAVLKALDDAGVKSVVIEFVGQS